MEPVPGSLGPKTGDTPETAEPRRTKSAEPRRKQTCRNSGWIFYWKPCVNREGSGLRGLERFLGAFVRTTELPVDFVRERGAFEG